MAVGSRHAPASSRLTPVRRGRRRRELVDAAALAGVVALPAALIWYFAAQSFFSQDDFFHMSGADHFGLTLQFLTEETTGGHFSPGHRLGHWVLQTVAPASWSFSLLMIVAFHSGSVVLMQRIMARLFGAPWWSYAVTLWFGLSVVYMKTLGWFAASMLVIPPTFFGLAAIHAWIVWRQTGRRRWLWWSAAAVGLGLLFYIKVLLVPLYIAMLRLVLARELLSPRRALRILIEDRVAWLAYAVPVGLYLLAYLGGGYLDPASEPKLSDLDDYMREAWLRGFVPTLLGLRYPADGDEHVGIVLIGQAAVLAFVVWTARRSRLARRACLFFAAAFTLNAVLVLPRVAEWGFGIGLEMRYFTEAAYLFPIAAAIALAVPVGMLPRDAAGARPSPMARPGRTALGVTVVLLVIYLVNVTSTYSELIRDFFGPDVRTWAERLDRDLDRLAAAAVEPVLVDGTAPQSVVEGWLVPPGVVPAWKQPSNRLSDIIPVLHPDVQFNRRAERMYAVTAEGSLREVRLAPAFTSTFREAVGSGRVVVSKGEVSYSGDAGCVSAGRSRARVEISPARHLRPGPDFYLSLERASGYLGAIPVFVDRGVGYPARHDRAAEAVPAPAESIVQLGPLPTGVPVLAGVRLRIPAGSRACFGEIALGAIVPRGGGAPL